MFKIGLIGKDISHSMSESMYKKILNSEFDFKILDYESENKIPSLSKLLEEFNGLCVTSPYKSFAFNNSVTSSSLESLKSVNCLKLHNQIVSGTNTDFLAAIEILEGFKLKGAKTILILGDGAMSRVISKACEKVGINYKISSRKTDSFASIKAKSDLLVNCCSRDLNLSEFNLYSHDKVWDLNYSQPYEKDLQLKLGSNYINGLELLFLQAKFAARYWEIS